MDKQAVVIRTIELLFCPLISVPLSMKAVSIKYLLKKEKLKKSTIAMTVLRWMSYSFFRCTTSVLEKSLYLASVRMG